MKIGVISDCHLNKAVYKSVSDREYSNLPFRTADFMRSFEYMVDECIRLAVDLVVLPGDIYDNFDPSNEVRGFFSFQMNKLSEAKIPSLILIGNHDVCMKHHALKDIKELGLKNIRVYESPSVLEHKGHQLLLFPYSLDIEQKKITIKDEFNRFVDEVGGKIKKDMPTIFFGHFGVRGGKMNDYIDTIQIKDLMNVQTVTDTTTTLLDVKKVKKVKKEFCNTNPNDVGCKDLDRIGADYVILGDYHQHQMLKTEKCIGMYTGSIEKTSMAEIDQKKGFILYDSDAEEIKYLGKCRFIEYPKCRPMIELKGNFIDIKKKFASIDYSKYQEAIVKISFEGTTEDLVGFSIGLEPFKKEIKQKLDAIHIYHEQLIKNEEQEELASIIEQQIMEKGHIEEADVIDVVKEMITEQVEDEKERDLTITLAEEIYEEMRVK